MFRSVLVLVLIGCTNSLDSYWYQLLGCHPPRSLRARAELVGFDNDRNGDGITDISDVEKDLIDYDYDNDVSRTLEWEVIFHWRCQYGWEEGYAKYFFSQIDRNKDGAVTIEGDLNSPFSFTGENFRKRQIEQFRTYCQTKENKAVDCWRLNVEKNLDNFGNFSLPHLQIKKVKDGPTFAGFPSKQQLSPVQDRNIIKLATEYPRSSIPDRPTFTSEKQLSQVQDRSIDEASGIAASKIHPDIIYTVNDKGDTNRVFVVNTKTGTTVAELTIDQVENYDWEDLAVGPCGSKSCIHIAETGDHGGDGAKNIIYRVVEPATLQNQTLQVGSELKYSWNETDCETVMVAPNEDIYVVSKVEGGHGRLGKLSHTGWGSGKREFIESSIVLKQSTTKKDPVGGDISPDGKEMLIKYKEHVFYWEVLDGNYIDAVKRSPVDLPYKIEKRGESICFDNKGSGYFTISEGKHPYIYYYERTSPIVG